MKPPGALAGWAVAWQAARELGARQILDYAIYQVGLRSGHYRRVTPNAPYAPLELPLQPLFALPDAPSLRAVLGGQAAALLDEAEAITAGQVTLFGARRPLRLAPPDAARHWTAYEGHPRTWGVTDIKDVWEPARFGWAYTLGRAYCLTGDGRYPAAFWQHLETFLQANPLNQGPNWMSGQEVALRLLALVFAGQAFAAAPTSTPDRQALLAGVVAAHAARIGPTLPYARAQNNNHLVSEALGLYAASCALPDHPQARVWRAQGWDWFQRALQRQIAADGSYAQHSLNYHRLMLHAALQFQRFAHMRGQTLPDQTSQRLAAAARWLLAQIDPIAGGAPNLGSNDGALILPLAGGLPEDQSADYRAVGQAAARAFLGQSAFPAGAWDELSLWLGLMRGEASPAVEPSRSPSSSAAPEVTFTAVLRLDCAPQSSLAARPETDQSGEVTQNAALAPTWATLRAVRFTSRPSHADQLHVELWWRGENLALDAGTYRYTAAPPWDNALASSAVHNTVQVDGQEPMQRAGRFLWLHWDQARVLTRDAQHIIAQRDGYARLGVLHRRELRRVSPAAWQVTDFLLPAYARAAGQTHTLRLHWLLPDWPYELEGSALTIHAPWGGLARITLSVHGGGHAAPIIQLLRAGQARTAAMPGEPSAPVLGWRSPTYGVLLPALSFSLTVQAALPVTLCSDWTLSEG